MVGASLLQSDDDSDVPDLDLRGPSSTSRRRKFFSKSTDYEEIRHRRKTYKTIFLFSFLFIFLVSLYFLYTAMTRIRLLSEEVNDLRKNMVDIDELRVDLKRVRMQFEVIRENSERLENNGTQLSIGGTTEMIYDKLANISTRFDLVWDGFQKNSMSMEDVTSRMSRVESKCLAVCQQQHDSAMPRGSREQPRRRQTKKTSGGADEIVFRRND